MSTKPLSLSPDHVSFPDPVEERELETMPLLDAVVSSANDYPRRPMAINPFVSTWGAAVGDLVLNDTTMRAISYYLYTAHPEGQRVYAVFRPDGSHGFMALYSQPEVLITHHTLYIAFPVPPLGSYTGKFINYDFFFETLMDTWNSLLYAYSSFIGEPF